MDRMDELLRFFGGKDFANKAQLELLERLGGVGAGGASGVKAGLARMAGSKAANNVLRVVPGLSVGMTALDAADILTNDTSLANKGMDTAGMVIGGAMGSVGGPLGAAAGASLGKMASDATQFVFGGGKSPEQRKLEEALLALQRGGLV